MSIQSKNGCCDANIWVDGPKEIVTKVTGKVFFKSWGYGYKCCNNSEDCSEPAELYGKCEKECVECLKFMKLEITAFQTKWSLLWRIC